MRRVTWRAVARWGLIVGSTLALLVPAIVSFASLVVADTWVATAQAAAADLVTDTPTEEEAAGTDPTEQRPAETGSPDTPSTPPEPATGQAAATLDLPQLPILSKSVQAERHGMDDAALIDRLGRGLFGSDWETAVELAGIWSNENALHYPFDYGALDVQVGSALQSADTDSALDLAGLVLLDAAKKESNLTEPSVEVPLAYSVLQTMAIERPSCTTKLAVAHAESLRTRSTQEQAEVRTLWAEAVEACEDDPGVRYLAAMDRFLTTFGDACGKGTPASDRTAALEDMRTLQRDRPESALGYVGEAEILLAMALGMLNDGVAVFSARSDLEGARVALSEAGELTTEPALEQLQARLLLAQGEADAAHAVAATWMGEELPPSALYIAAASNAATGAFQEAAELAALALNDEAAFDRLARRASFPEHVDEIVGYERGLGHQFFSECGGVTVLVDNSLLPPFRSYSGPESSSGLLSPWGSGYRGDGAPERYAALADISQTIAGIDWSTVGGEDPTDQEWLQNAARMWGQLDLAEQIIRKWVENAPWSGMAHDRLGELLYLQGKYDEAASAFRDSLEAFDGGELEVYFQIPYGFEQPAEEWWDYRSSGPAWVALRLGAALASAGQNESARAALSAAAVTPTGFLGIPDTRVEFYALSQLAAIEYDEGDYADSLTHLEEAVALAESYEVESQVVWLRGAEEQRAAAASIQLGDPETAGLWAKRALERDPLNPLYAEAVAEAARLAVGDTSQPSATPSDTPMRPTEASAISSPSAATEVAEPVGTEKPSQHDVTTTEAGHDVSQLVASYVSALRADDSLFSSWNNLGAILWNEGDRVGAAHAFARAVTERPDYALAWYNLGSAWSQQRGFGAGLAAQGAFGRAAQLDHELRNAEPRIAFDEVLYDSNLDVSQPIPAEWRLTDSVAEGGSRLTVGLIALIAVRLIWAFGADATTNGLVARGLRVGSQHPVLARLGRVRPWWYLMALVSSVSVWVLSQAHDWLAQLLLASAIIGLIGVHMTTSSLAAPSRSLHRGVSAPASVLTLALGALGFGFAPPPVVRDSAQVATRAVRVGAGALALATVVYFMVSAVTGAPVASAVASACLIVVASATVPIRPLDGAHFALRRWQDLLITVGLAAGTGLVALKFV